MHHGVIIDWSVESMSQDCIVCLQNQCPAEIHETTFQIHILTTLSSPLMTLKLCWKTWGLQNLNHLLNIPKTIEDKCQLGVHHCRFHAEPLLVPSVLLATFKKLAISYGILIDKCHEYMPVYFLYQINSHHVNALNTPEREMRI